MKRRDMMKMVSLAMIPMMSGERVDAILDFTHWTNSVITMTNLILSGNVPFAPFIKTLKHFNTAFRFLMVRFRGTSRVVAAH